MGKGFGTSLLTVNHSAPCTDQSQAFESEKQAQATGKETGSWIIYHNNKFRLQPEGAWR